MAGSAISMKGNNVFADVLFAENRALYRSFHLGPSENSYIPSNDCQKPAFLMSRKVSCLLSSLIPLGTSLSTKVRPLGQPRDKEPSSVVPLRTDSLQSPRDDSHQPSSWGQERKPEHGHIQCENQSSCDESTIPECKF